MDGPVQIDLHAGLKRLETLCKEQKLPLATDLTPDRGYNQYLAKLAEISLAPKYVLPVLASHGELALEIIARWITDAPDKDHDRVIVALGLIASVFPEADVLIEGYLSQNERYQRLLSSSVDCGAALLAIYRLLAHDRERYVKYVEPSHLYTIISDSKSQVWTYLSLQILGHFFHSSKEKVDQWLAQRMDLSKPIIGDLEYTKRADYLFLSVLEAKRIGSAKGMVQRCAVEVDETQLTYTCSKLLVNLCGVLVPRLNLPHDYISSFVRTSGALNAIRDLAIALRSSDPLLLTGHTGAGKTFYVDELSKIFGRHDDLVRIHLGDQTDAKILVGTYSTGEKPGSFEWCPGILTVAVKEGRWVLIEDIDKAPTEILSVLLPLLEKRELLIPSRGEVVKAGRGFQVFATMKTLSRRDRSGDEPDMIPDIIGKRLWRQVPVVQPTMVELKHIIQSRFPLLANLAERFIETYEQVLLAYASSNKLSQGRQISSRDLIKWAKRVDQMLRKQGITKPDDALPSALYDHIFAEAVDCFGGFLSSIHAREYIVHVIGEALHVPSVQIELFLKKHTPTFSITPTGCYIGRAAQLDKSYVESRSKARIQEAQRSKFALTNHSLRLLEQVAVGVSMAEPTLLVGETGTGKTTVVQFLASLLGKNLTVINVSQQTESGDLLGGYRPVDPKMIAFPLREEYESLFDLTFSKNKNEEYFALLARAFNSALWKGVVDAWRKGIKSALKKLSQAADLNEAPKKKRRLDNDQMADLIKKWSEFSARVDNFETQVKQISNSFVFKFVEGSLIEAVRRGDWVLLDEINLASPDTLESISDLLIENPSITLSEKGDTEAVRAHPQFRLFACMNPATDVGKRDLPAGLRSRFTELYVSSPDQDMSDLLAIINKYIGDLIMNDKLAANDVAELYLEAKRLSEENKIVDGANQKPHFSIRTLSRTLVYAVSISRIYNFRRSLYEGFCMSFLTLLDKTSEGILMPSIEKYTIGRLKNAKSVMSQIPPPPNEGQQEFVQFKHYWLHRGRFEVDEQTDYIITPFVEKNLLNLARATAGRKFPVLIQGPTSSGKTSMIRYLAKRTGHHFVRINNHEHTDLQEYIGSYVSDEKGKLKFQEGVLVQALRNGYWIVLDELNLAPTDVLEALNRLLDDNRELLIPETQEIVRPHPDFMLFATQNPPGLYGGRKILSRAFRNRFLELHFDDIPQDELEDILTKRCKIAPSYSKRIVEVYRQLSVQRQSVRIFEQKNSFATLRDLFRWAQRDAVGYEQLALNGYMLLGERVRKREEKEIVKQVIEKVMKTKIDVDQAYNGLQDNNIIANDNTVVWTKGMRRLLVLVCEALKYNEPVLLVGETGCGKTTICQILASAVKKELHIVNAHQNTESGDIIGAQRPVRNRSDNQTQLADEIRKALAEVGHGFESYFSYNLEKLKEVYATINHSTLNSETITKIKSLEDRLQVLFEWSDGSLIQALKLGDFFLLDEISLADDSVLERLNSVLEPERTLLLSEKASQDNNIIAQPGFQFFATMNPGGDYGKKELSPALRNRFTEIWVPSMEDFDDVLTIVESRLNPEVSKFAKVIVKFGEWFGKTYGAGDASSGIISLRDILAWINFVNKLSESISPEMSVFHGACMVFIDSVGSNASANLAQSADILKRHRLECVEKLSSLLGFNFKETYLQSFDVEVSPLALKVGPFTIERDPSIANVGDVSFNLTAPTTAMNALRVIRGMQARKPILLEGSPGVGKTSLITAIAKVVGRPLTRINLSEQTDLIDLFGSDTPAEGKSAGEFVWRDAPFLRAMQQGEWVLLDEMNLASQSVLEGLNACLDHRGEAYIPELDKTFKCNPGFTVFAAQNPQYQGGGRKGLPKSFINRFSVVYVDVLTFDDLKLISKYLHPGVDHEIVDCLIGFVAKLDYEVSVRKSFGHLGSPFEFNLRDTMRWLSLLDEEGSLSSRSHPYDFFDLIISSRFRTASCRRAALGIFKEFFGGQLHRRDPYCYIGESFVQAGNALVPRLSDFEFSYSLQHLQCNANILESVLICLKKSWPVILTGPTNSGKTSLLRFIATSLGADLKEFSMNSDIDSTDLLGGFDQVDIAHKSADVWNEAISLSNDVTTYVLGLDSEALLKEILDTPTQILKHCLTRTGTGVSELRALSHALDTFPAINPDLNCRVRALRENVMQLMQEVDAVQTVRFQWFDGTLLTAVEEGHWLVLDNANLCNPSVLDRLNSLLEPNGCLMVNECALENGEPRVVKPHKNFRLFLTVDPRYGELSRAMRNRGVEIFMECLDERATEYDKRLLHMVSDKISPPNLLDSMDMLTVAEVDRLYFPTSEYIKPSEDVAKFFGVMDDMISSRPIADPNKLAVAAINVVPLSVLQVLRRWYDTLLNSELFSLKSKQFYEQLLLGLEGLDKTTYISTLKDLYGVAQLGSNASVIADRQPLNSMVNKYLSRFANYARFRVSTRDMVLLLRLALGCDMLRRILEDSVEHAVTKKPSEMSYLVKSAALAKNKPLKHPVKVPVYSIVESAVLFLYDVLEELLAYRCDLGLNEYDGLRKLLQLSFDLVYITNSSATDESQLPIYRDYFNQWIASYGSCTLFSSRLTSLSDWISRFGAELTLSSGTSMVVIWKSLKGSNPLSESGYSRFANLRSISKRFDEISQKIMPEHISVVSTLRHELLLIMNDLRCSKNSGSYIATIEHLENGISKLEDLTKDFYNVRTHFYEQVFSLISTTVELSTSGTKTIESPKFDDLLTLAYRSGVSTEHLSAYASDDISKPYHPVFDSLWRKTDLKSLFDDSHITWTLAAKRLFESISSKDYMQCQNDYKSLSQTLIKNMGRLMADKLQWFATMLKQSIDRVVAMHRNDSLPSTVRDKFSLVYDKYFAPSLDAVNESSSRSIGEGWILFALGMVLLFVPDIPFDPAIGEHVAYSRYLHLNEERKVELRSWEQVRQIFLGPVSTEVDEIIQSQYDLISVQKPGTYRPKSSKISPLHQDWMSLVESAANEEVLQRLATATAKQIDIWQINTLRFVDKMKKEYEGYDDVTSILVGIVYGLKLGVELYHLPAKTESTNMWLMDSVLLAGGDLESALSTLIAEGERGQPLNMNSTTKLHVLKMVALQQSISQSFGSCKALFDCLLKDFHLKWKLLRKKEEEEAIAKSSIYKDTSEEDVEEEFRQMFPDYEGDLPSSKADEEAVVNFALSEIYMNLFCGNEIDFSDTLLQATRIAAATSDTDTSGIAYTKGGDRVIPTLLLSMGRDLVGQADSANKTAFNFYHESNLDETRRVILLIQKLKQRVFDISKQWPEHSTLQNITMACEELLVYPITTPIARFLQKVEQIFTFLNEWQKYASRQYSLADEMNEVSSLIVSWRKLELSTWPTLFEHEARAVRKEVGRWWFHLYETLIVKTSEAIMSGVEDYRAETADIVQALSVYLSDASKGQFAVRIKLLQSFCGHLAIFESSTANLVVNAIENVISFFKQFEADITQSIAQGTKALRKEVQDVILLASWKDINADALKESARRSHFKLYKIIRKYRELLKEPVKPIVENASSHSVVGTDRKFGFAHLTGCVPVSSLQDMCKTMSESKDRSPMLSDDKVLKNFSYYVDRVDSLELFSLEEFTGELMAEVSRLRKETPSTLTEDNKKIVSQLRMEKGKLLSDSLKELRQMGLNTRVKASVSSRQQYISVILANSASLGGFGIDKSEGTFFRLLEMLPRLRSAVASQESDVPAADLSRGLAIAENLLDSILTLRSKLSTSSAGLRDIKSLYDSSLSLLSLDGKGDHITAQPIRLENVRCVLSWVPQFMSFVMESVRANDYLQGNGSGVGLLQILMTFVSRAKDLQLELDQYGKLSEVTITTELMAKLVHRISTEFIELNKNLAQKEEENPSIQYIANLIRIWSEQQLSALTRASVVSDSSEVESFQWLENHVRKLAMRIMVVMQDVKKLFDESISDEDDQCYVRTLNQAVSADKLLKRKLVIKTIADILQAVGRLASANKQDSAKAIAIYGSIVPFIAGYVDLCSVVANKLVSVYSSTTQASFTLYSILHELASKGFCTPQEPQQQEKDAGATSEGTGLGDGAGAESSKDVEDDEDLSEHAQKDNEEQEKDDLKDNEEEDNAVDIEGDMAGQLEDAPDQEEDENDEDDNDEEEEDIEDEVGDIDDLDPNAIDEKMWEDDQNEKKDQKEKQSEAVPDKNDNEDNDGNAEEGEPDAKDQENKDKEENEEDENAEEEEDVGEQDDEVRNQEEREDLEQQAEETETLQLPEDMALDDEEEGKEDNDDQFKDELEDQMDEPMDEAEGLDEGEEEEKKEEVEPLQEDAADDATFDKQDVDDKDEEVTDTEEKMEEEDDAHAERDENDVDMEGQKEEEMAIDTEGLGGTADNEDLVDENQATSGEASANKSQGADQTVGEEKEDVDTGNAPSSIKVEENQKPENANPEDQAEKKASQSMKQLGDALKEFHKRRQEIKEAGERDDTVEDTSAERPDEFQHMDEEESSYDTQALGSANQDYNQKIDDSMAIEDEEEENDKDQSEEQTNEREEDIEEAANDGGQNAADSHDMPAQGLSMIGERSHEDQDLESFGVKAGAMELSDDEEEASALYDEDGNEMVPSRHIEEARDLWRKYEVATQDLSLQLTEQLRLILEPTQATKLRGDFKTGKRLNMKRIIPYIASQFKKDKIWMRRTKPSKRQYQIMIAIDDSKSMSESKSVDLAFQSIALVSKALTQLEAGQLAITRFGATPHMIHPFQKPFSPEAGAEVLQWFGFEQTKTDVRKLLEKSIQLFEDAQSEAPQGLWRLEVIISDGLCDNHTELRRLVRKAQEERLMLVFIVVDCVHKDQSILETSSVGWEVDSATGRQKMVMKKYLDEFAFDYYVIVRDIRELPAVLSSVLRQYFAEVSEV
ncbi:midasin [Trichomonascus vanleenenianus]|uniref:AAA family ATPase midasin n=1 Tax=Trichomonascus vanleenenianus TaxID=2268995 RepID=UPI003ECB655C